MLGRVAVRLRDCFDGGRGEVRAIVRLIAAAEVGGPALFSAEVPVKFSGPLATPEVGLVIPPVTFPRAEGALWHNWSPPLMVLHYSAKDQTPANATVGYVLGE